MIWTSSRRTFFIFCVLCPVVVAAGLCVSSLSFSAAPGGPQQASVNPTTTIDQPVTAFAYAADGRMAFSVRHVFKTRQLELQRDDIYLLDRDGRQKKVVDGERLVRGPAAFVYSYAIQSIRFSPDGGRLAVEMLYSVMTDERGNQEDGLQSLLLDSTGKEIKVQGGDSVIPGATQPAWLNDGATLVYLREAVKPRLLFSIAFVRPVAGRGGQLHDGRTFSAVAWDAPRSAAVGVERAPSLTGPIRLTWLDLLREDSRELGIVPAFAGQLSLSPSGKRVAYFADSETLEVREVAAPERVMRLHIPYGTYVWHPDESRILLKPGVETANMTRSSTFLWVELPSASSGGAASPVPSSPSAPGKSAAAPSPASRAAAADRIEPKITPALYGLTFRSFDISPDGRTIAVTQPGTRYLLLYPLQ